MIRNSELELHERAMELFEQENPGKFWRLSSGRDPKEEPKFAGLIERQNYLARVRELMRAEGIIPETGDEFAGK